MGKVAIVLGATGLIGSHIVRQLSEHSEFSLVKSITRRESPVTHTKIKNHIVDFDELDRFTEAFEGDVMFSCLGTTKKQAGSIYAQRRVDVDYQLKAAQLAANNSVAHYLLVSSIGANPSSLSPYLKMKGELENRVKQLTFERISIFRPSLLVGKRSECRAGEAFGSLVMPALCKLPPLKRYHPIKGRQVAAEMIATSVKPGETIEYFELNGSKTLIGGQQS